MNLEKVVPINMDWREYFSAFVPGHWIVIYICLQNHCSNSVVALFIYINPCNIILATILNT